MNEPTTWLSCGTMERQHAFVGDRVTSLCGFLERDAGWSPAPERMRCQTCWQKLKKRSARRVGR